MNNEALTATLSSKLDELTVDIQKIARSLADQNKSSVPEVIDSRGNSNLEACVQTAGKIVSSAASIVYERSIRGSEAGESVLGDGLSVDKRRGIESWIPANTIVEELGELLPASRVSLDGTSFSEASDDIFSPTGTSYTGLTSPVSEQSKFRFDYRTIAEERFEQTDNVEEETIPLEMPDSLLPLNTKTVSESDGSTGAVTGPPTNPANQIKINFDIGENNSVTLIDVLETSVTGSNIEDLFLQDLRKRAMVKFEQREYAAAESLLENILKES